MYRVRRRDTSRSGTVVDDEKPPRGVSDLSTRIDAEHHRRRARQMTDAIVARGLTKSYGDVHALSGLDLTVAEGTILGLLGPNGAGKTTCVRILTTLLEPDSGTATVAGFDVVTQGRELRRVIGLSGQYAAVDEHLTGFENLDMVGRLYHLGRARSRGTGQGAARALRPRRRRRTDRQGLLRRHASAARPRRGAGGRAAGARSRRADHRSRPAQPPRHVGRHQRPGPRAARRCC